jgi:hypothetical protein
MSEKQALQQQLEELEKRSAGVRDSARAELMRMRLNASKDKARTLDRVLKGRSL